MQSLWQKNYVVCTRALKPALNHRLFLKIVHRVIQCNQEAWIKRYINMNNKFRKEAKNDFGKDSLRLTKNSVSGKTMENVRKHKDIK